MPQSPKIKNFTLIEMLIVIVIIGILAAALIPRLQSIQWRARDTKRKTDLKNIYNANEIFALDNGGKYARPYNATWWWITWYVVGASVCSDQWPTPVRIFDLSGVMTDVPKDPLNIKHTAWPCDSPGPWSPSNATYVYQYGYLVNWGKSYDLTAQLENKRDPDRCEVRDYDWGAWYPSFTGRCDGGAWNSNYSKYLYEYSPDSKSF